MKKFLMGIIAIVLAIGFSAFTKAHEKKATDGELWFHFTGSNNIAEDLTNVDKYELDNGTGANPTVCTSSNTYMCEILIAPQSGDATKPDLEGSNPIDQTERSTP